MILNDVTIPDPSPSGRQQDLLEFNSLFPDIVRDLTETDNKYYDVDVANKWFQKVGILFVIIKKRNCKQIK